MSSMAQDMRQQIMQILKKEEEQTDLENLAVLSRVGLRVASATSTDLDADAVNASSSALTDLGIRLSEATNHGSLKEILLHNESGYSILIAINNEYIVFSALKAVYRIGYYLGYLRHLSRKLNKLISGDKESVMSLSLEESEKEKLKTKEEEKPKEKKVPMKPSVEQDKEALDGILEFFDEWSPESAEDFGDLEESQNENIVSIPSSNVVSIPDEGGSQAEGAVVPEGPSEESLDELASIAEESAGQAASQPEPETETETEPSFKVYDDEVPPIPLDDYTPIMVEEEAQASQAAEEPQIEETPPVGEEEVYAEEEGDKYAYDETEEIEEAAEDLPPLEEVPDFDEVSPPDFDRMGASEYQTDFVLDEETEDLDEALEELGYEEEEE